MSKYQEKYDYFGRFFLIRAFSDTSDDCSWPQTPRFKVKISTKLHKDANYNIWRDELQHSIFALFVDFFAFAPAVGWIFIEIASLLVEDLSMMPLLLSQIFDHNA